MQVAELLAPPPEVADHPAVSAAHRCAADLLEPHAAAADDPTRGVRREHLDALAAVGLASVKVPQPEGGLGAGTAVDAEVVEVLAAACGATWFVLTQHRLSQNLARAPLADLPDGVATPGPAGDRYRDALNRGTNLAGIAVAHLRRPGPPAVTAEPDGRGGHLLSGRADWCTGWGLLDLVLIAALTPDDRFVFGLVPAAERDGLRAGPPLPLAVMGGTATVALQLDRCPIAPDEVLLTVDAAAWRAVDLAKTANTTPAALGLLRRVLVELERLGHERDRPPAIETALALARQVTPLRAEAYTLLAQPPQTHLARRTEVRGQLGELSVRAASALVAARAGSAMLSSSPEQRWAREAMFHLVQAQTADVRAAQLVALRTPGRDHPNW